MEPCWRTASQDWSVFAACAYAHYLNYGLRLKRASAFRICKRGHGEIFIMMRLNIFRRVEKIKYTWFNIPEDVQETFIEESMNDAMPGAKMRSV